MELKDLPNGLQRGQKLVVASHNPGKVREINELISPFGLRAISAGELGLPEPAEDGDSFAANAIIKARAAAKGSGLPALSDDSGLEVHGLDGAPGIFSARWAGENKDFNHAMQHVEDELVSRGCVSENRRGANFTCALALMMPGGEPEVFEGKVFGHLIWPPRGKNGFGYDPMFVPEGEYETFGEMEPARKHAMSHRAKAFALFQAAALAHLA